MTKAEYRAECQKRWYGIALRDALSNWDNWEELRDYLIHAMREFRRNPFQEDMAGKCHNSYGNLDGFLFNCADALRPNKYRIDPLLDFEEHYQKIFLRRGLRIYCRAILEELEQERRASPRQIALNLTTAAP